MSNENVLLQVKNLKQYFNQGKHNEVKAIDNISFDVYKGETLGLVGESGCGKSTTGKAIIKLNDITDGAIEYDGKDIHQIRKRKERLKFNKKNSNDISRSLCISKSSVKGNGYRS